MRELNAIEKKNIEKYMIAAYDEIFNMIIADYTNYNDDDDTLRGIATFSRECLTELTTDYTESLADLKHW